MRSHRVRVPRWIRRSLVVDVAGYVSGHAIGMAIAAVAGIIVARYLGPSDLGLLGFAGSIYGLAVPIALLGMRLVLIKEFSATTEWQPILASALSRQIPTAVVVSVIGFGIITIARDGDPTAVLVALALLPLPVLATRDTIQALHESAGHVRLVVGAALGSTVVVSTVKLLAVVADAPVWVFAAATTLGGALILAMLMVGHRRSFGRISLLSAVDRDRAKGLVRESWPLLIGALAVTVYMKIDIAMLGLLAGDQETGIYVAAARISELWYFIPVAAMTAVRPRLSRYFANGDMARYGAETQQFLSIAWWVSLVAVALTLVFGGGLVLLLYGSAFAGAEAVLRIHILAAPFVFLGVGASQWFVDRGLTRAVMIRSVTGAAINVAVNIALIPAYGAIGAAVATLVSYAFSSVIMNGMSRHTREVFRMQLRALSGRRH